MTIKFNSSYRRGAAQAYDDDLKKELERLRNTTPCAIDLIDRGRFSRLDG
jgi:hypothetical protein